MYCYDLRVPYYLSNNTLKYLIDYILQARLYYVSVYWVHQFKGLLIQISDQSHVNYSVHLGIRLSAEVWPQTKNRKNLFRWHGCGCQTGLVECFRKCSSTEIPLQSQVCGSSLGENTLFMLEVAGEWPDTWHTLGTLVQPVHGLNATAEPEYCCWAYPILYDHSVPSYGCFQQDNAAC